MYRYTNAQVLVLLKIPFTLFTQNDSKENEYFKAKVFLLSIQNQNSET